jgi:hypothetical protein
MNVALLGSKQGFDSCLVFILVDDFFEVVKILVVFVVLNSVVLIVELDLGVVLIVELDLGVVLIVELDLGVVVEVLGALVVVFL